MTGFATVDTPCGPFTVVARQGVVLASGWTADPAQLVAHPERWPAPRDLGPVTDAVHAYFHGEVDAIAAVAVGARSGPFVMQVWAALRAAPAGSQITYQALAERGGRPGAARAAGTACGRNQAALFVPCHRAVRSDGGLAGFRWGLGVKRWLLDHETASVASDGQLAGHGVVGMEVAIDDVLLR